MREFEVGDWVWFIRTEYRTEEFPCHSCHTYVTKRHETKVVAKARIEVITEQSFLHGRNRISYTLGNAEAKIYAVVLWQNDGEESPLYLTKEEAEVALSKQEKHKVETIRDDELYGENP